MTGVTSVDYQVLFNITFAIAGALAGWALRNIWNEVMDLQKADAQLSDRVAQIHVLVAGGYITRDEFQRDISTLFSKLDHISEKLDTKQDRGRV
jgi:hypothetical protein